MRNISMPGWYGSDVFHEKACAKCGLVFKPRTGRARFCSLECRYKTEKERQYNTTERQYERVNASERGFWVRLIHGRGKGAAGSRSELTPEFLEELYLKQEGHCAISGVLMDCELKLGGSWTRCSVDRIDNLRGYELDNVHLVCKDVNISRNRQTLQEFIEMCRAVTEYQNAR